MPTDLARPDYLTAETHPGKVPQGELWFSDRLTSRDYFRLAAHNDPVVRHYAGREYVRRYARDVLDQAGYDDDHADELADQLAGSLPDGAAQEDLAKLTPQSILAEFGQTTAPEPQDTAAVAQALTVLLTHLDPARYIAPFVQRLDRLTTQVARLAATVAEQRPPQVTVELPPPNPTPVQLHMPAAESRPKPRRRRFTYDQAGEVTGIEDCED